MKSLSEGNLLIFNELISLVKKANNYKTANPGDSYGIAVDLFEKDIKELNYKSALIHFRKMRMCCVDENVSFNNSSDKAKILELIKQLDQSE